MKIKPLIFLTALMLMSPNFLSHADNEIGDVVFT